MSTLTALGPVVVCHALPPAERLPAVVRTFDALAPGEAFELRSDHAPKAALGHLQKERPALFEWSPLQEGPELWRTRVARRADRTAHRAVTEALTFDHDRLDDLEGCFGPVLDLDDFMLVLELLRALGREVRLFVVRIDVDDHHVGPIGLSIGEGPSHVSVAADHHPGRPRQG